uniref:Glucan endo-1,3-beta-D-glucosidase n=1 Tax=Solanum lycopersicum TaxID=4081 RepID=A0A3Q7EF39_SOLLC
MLGIPNSDVKHIASSGENSRWWVEKNVRAFYRDVNIKYIVVGNGISPFKDTSDLTSHLKAAMSRTYNSVYFTGLGYNINVTTSIDMTLMGKSYPPSHGSFRDDARKFFDPIVEFLRNTNAPLLLNFSYSSNPGQISLPYALFTAPNVVVQDGLYQYRNLFDAMVDSVYAAIDQIPGRPDQSSIRIIVSETGWPSAGGFGATTENAATCLRNLIQHAKMGTPRKPVPIETYLFAMFDEKHFGLFSPNKQPKYQQNLGTSDISAETNVTASSLISEM